MTHPNAARKIVHVIVLKEFMGTVTLIHCLVKLTTHGSFRCCSRWKPPHFKANLNITMVRARYFQTRMQWLAVGACVSESFYREMKETAEGL